MCQLLALRTVYGNILLTLPLCVCVLTMMFYIFSLSNVFHVQCVRVFFSVNYVYILLYHFFLFIAALFGVIKID